MPKVESQKIEDLSRAVEGRVLEALDEANEILPRLREIDQDLYTTVHFSLAIAYTGATSYMYTAVQGAAECFSSMSEALSATSESWTAADEAAAEDFK